MTPTNIQKRVNTVLVKRHLAKVFAKAEPKSIAQIRREAQQALADDANREMGLPEGEDWGDT